MPPTTPIATPGVPNALVLTGPGAPENPEPTGDPNVPILPKVADLKDERGQTGTLVLSGFISGEEYNSDLIGTAGLAVWDRMRKSDAAVSATLKLMKLPIKASKWGVDPAGDTDDDAFRARFIDDALLKRIDWEMTLSEILTFLEFGHAVLEKVYEVSTFEGRTVITLKKLAFRKQLSILKWLQVDGTAGITQITGTGGVFSIPADKLVVLTNEREGNNYAGVSILRPAYKHWYIKDQLYQISAIAHERQGLGVVSITPPDNADEGDRAKAISAAQNIRANESAYIEVPSGWTVDFMDMKGHTTIDPNNDITHHNRMIWTNILGQFMEMGSHSGSGGTRSSSQDQSKYLDLNLESVANNIKTTLQREVIKQLIDLNFNVTENDYPQLRHSDLGETNIQTISAAIAALTAVNMITPTAETEGAIRDVLNLPELDERYADDYENRPKVVAETGGLDPTKNMGVVGPDGKPMLPPATLPATLPDGSQPGNVVDDKKPAVAPKTVDPGTIAEVKKAAEAALEASDRILDFYARA